MTTINGSARVGVITDQAGALSFTGIANINVAKMVIDDLNDCGGLPGRPVESSWAASTAPRDRSSGDPCNGRFRGRHPGFTARHHHPALAGLSITRLRHLAGFPMV